MSAIRIDALRALRGAIEAGVPELAGRVSPWDPNRTGPRPRLMVIPAGRVYRPNQAVEVRDLGPEASVFQVGHWEATVQMRLEHDTPEQRAATEERIAALFLGASGRPGVLVTRVEADDLGPFTVAWELGDDAWNDDLTLNNEYESTVTLTAIIPALVVRRGIPRIRRISLDLAVNGGAAERKEIG